MDIALDLPIFSESSTRAAHFFNGRLLTAEDLSREQQANTDGHKQLGRALGDGVVRGLEVREASNSTVARPVLSISAGLAFNRRGRAVELMNDVALPLVKPPATPTAVGDDGFDECTPAHQGVYILESEGVYLLTVKPSEAREGRALVSGLNNGTAACNSKNRVAAVKFRLVSLKDKLATELTSLTEALKGDNSAANRARQTHKLRNRVAHRCLGTDDPRLNSFVTNPFGATATTYGLLDDLRPDPLTDCDVPLAVMYWTRDGVQFVDMWAVRRRITAPTPAGFGWPLLADRRRAEGEAMFWQFQEHIQAIQQNLGNAQTAVATQMLSYLPPVGMLPLANTRMAGFAYRNFFQGQTIREPAFVESAQVSALMQDALNYSAIDLSSKVVIWLYLVRENVQQIDANPFAPTQPYLIFVSGFVRNWGDARYDVNRFGYANIARQEVL